MTVWFIIYSPDHKYLDSYYFMFVSLCDSEVLLFEPSLPNISWVVVCCLNVHAREHVAQSWPRVESLQ